MDLGRGKRLELGAGQPVGQAGEQSLEQSFGEARQPRHLGACQLRGPSLPCRTPPAYLYQCSPTAPMVPGPRLEGAGEAARCPHPGHLAHTPVPAAGKKQARKTSVPKIHGPRVVAWPGWLSLDSRAGPGFQVRVPEVGQTFGKSAGKIHDFGCFSCYNHYLNSVQTLYWKEN